MPPRVVFWSELFWPNIGGAEVFAAELMGALRERGFDFVVITSRDPANLSERDFFRGIPIYRFLFRDALAPSRLEDALRLRRHIGELLASLAADLVHLNGVSPSAFFCLDAVRRTGLPLLARLNREPQSSEGDRYRRSLLAQVLATAGWTAAVSRSLLDLARALEPRIRPRSSVVYNGVETAPRCPAPPPTDEPLLLCLGRLVDDKGFDIAIDAFARIAATWPRARLRVVGEGPARSDLERRAAQRGVAPRVEFFGALPPEATPAAFAAATLVLMPSRVEGLPSVALQAAAAGRALIASRAGGLPELVRDGETGILVDNDAGAFATAVAHLLRDPEKSRHMGSAAWRMARREFSLRSCHDAYAALYERIRVRPS
jgi:glycogen(starch) synthase